MKPFNSKKLKELRLAALKTLEEVADENKFDKSSLSLWENGRKPGLKNLKRLSVYYKVPLSAFFALIMFVTPPAHAGATSGIAAGGAMIALQVGHHARLSPHFTAHEFWCHDGCRTSKVDGRLLYKLELLRVKLGGRAIRISSGYRCEGRNKSVGGAGRSQHMQGKAADIQVDSVPPVVVAAAAKSVGFSFVKIYPKHTHVDVR